MVVCLGLELQRNVVSMKIRTLLHAQVLLSDRSDIAAKAPEVVDSSVEDEESGASAGLSVALCLDRRGCGLGILPAFTAFLSFSSSALSSSNSPIIHAHMMLIELYQLNLQCMVWYNVL